MDRVDWCHVLWQADQLGRRRDMEFVIDVRWREWSGEWRYPEGFERRRRRGGGLPDELFRSGVQFADDVDSALFREAASRSQTLWDDGAEVAPLGDDPRLLAWPFGGRVLHDLAS